MMSKPMVYVVHGWEAENIDSILRQVKKKCSDNGTQQNGNWNSFFKIT